VTAPDLRTDVSTAGDLAIAFRTDVSMGCGVGFELERVLSPPTSG
jgi:hypothetical protein